VRAGLHDGVRSLVEGGVPPGFLIIDDGWQCTDVDEPLRQVHPVPDQEYRGTYDNKWYVSAGTLQGRKVVSKSPQRLVCVRRLAVTGAGRVKHVMQGAVNME